MKDFEVDAIWSALDRLAKAQEHQANMTERQGEAIADAVRCLRMEIVYCVRALDSIAASLALMEIEKQPDE